MDARRLVPFLYVTLLAACSSPTGVGPREEALASLSTVSALVEALRDAGASVVETGKSVESIFTVPAEVLLVDGVEITAHAFPTPAEAAADVPRLEQALALWARPMRLYRGGSLLVLAPGDDAELTRLLEGVLGRPVARVG